MREVAKGYGNLARICNRLAVSCAGMGSQLTPYSPGWVDRLSHIAEVAGLGAIGYHGMLITPMRALEYASTPFTPISPIAVRTGNEHVWVRDFCAKCKKCIRGCPVQAIYEHPFHAAMAACNASITLLPGLFNQEFGCAICWQNARSGAGYEKVRMRFKGNPKHQSTGFRWDVMRFCLR
jgi:epoxyqueuosine reductase QueG